MTCGSEAWGLEEVPGADQIAQMLAVTPRERLQCLLDMLAFEERAHRAVLVPEALRMARFQPEEMLRTLERHGVRYVLIGGLGSTLHGSPLPTRDADICPAPDGRESRDAGRRASRLGARIRTEDAPEGLPFACDAAFLRQMKLLNLTTRFGDLDLSFEPAGTGGYDQLAPRSVRYDLGEGLLVPVAALEDIIHSKETANREKNRQALPTLRRLLQKTRRNPPAGA